MGELDQFASPAADVVNDAPPVEGVTPPASQTGTPPTPTTPEPPTRQEPDLEALLADEEFSKKLVAHPKVKQTLDGMLGARLQREREVLTQRIQAEQVERDRQALVAHQKEMDEYELGAIRKQELVREDEARAQAQRQTEIDAARQEAWTFGQIKGVIDKFGQRAAQLLDETEFAKIHPERFKHFDDPAGAYIDAIVEILVEKKAAAKAEKLAEARAEAIVQQRLGEQRDGAEVVPVLPNGSAVGKDKDFLAAYSRGESQDHARASKILAGL